MTTDLLADTDLVSRFVKEVSQMPEVRDEVVEAFKVRVRSGRYPSIEVLDGVVDRMGPAIVRQARSDSFLV